MAPFSARRATLSIAVTTLLVGAGAIVATTPASATTHEVGPSLSLTDALQLANEVTPGPDTITLPAGETITYEPMIADYVGEELVIEMNGATVIGLRLFVGADLTLRGGTWEAIVPEEAGALAAGIAVASSGSLTLESMTVTAQGSHCDAGIGGYFSAAGAGSDCVGGDSTPSGPITIVDSTVTATGGSWSAGIGGATFGDHALITIENSTVVATGGVYGPGIGAGKNGTAGLISITDSTVTATGGPQSAGIGGGDRGNGGTVTIDGGTVTATGTGNAAGIGGGFAGNGGTTTITGDAVVDARGGSFGTGIGGGFMGAGGPTSIGGKAQVTALGLDGAPGIGSSYTATLSGPTVVSDGSPTLTANGIQSTFDVVSGAALTVGASATLLIDGSALNGGVITLPENAELAIAADDTLINEGVIAGSGELTGSGTVQNFGTICAGVGSGLTVTGNAFMLEFSLPAGGTETLAVYATTLTEGCRELLTPPANGQVLLGWRLGDSGPYLTRDTELPVAAPSGTATLEPVLAEPVLRFEPSPSTSVAGETVQVRAFGPFPMSMNPDVELTEFVLLTGDVDFGATPGGFVSTTAGEQEISGTTGFVLPEETVVLSGTFTHTTTAAPLATLAIEATATTVRQGGSVTLTVGGADGFGNPIVILPGDVTVTSDVATDVVDGLTVTFPTASPHTLTVTVGEVSAQLVIEVEAAAVIPNPTTPTTPTPATSPSPPRLASTGSDTDTNALGALALVLMTLGAAAAVGGRRARIRSPR